MSTPNLPGYPIGVGAKKLSVIAHAGPASYTQVTTGPLAGGDTLQAVDFGMKYLENVDGGITSDGLYRAEPINGLVPATSIPVRWTVVATGAQVAGAFALNGSTVNMIGVGI